jgi:hypothetical protein
VSAAPVPAARPDVELHLTVFGTPAPQGSKRGFVRNGQVRLVESSPDVKPWREAVKQAALDKLFERGTNYVDPDDGQTKIRPAPAMDGPLGIEVVFTVRKTADRPKTKRSWPDRKPDIDKLLRSTFDALSDAGAWRDDARVVEVHAFKVFPGEHALALHTPGAWIRVWQVTS